MPTASTVMRSPRGIVREKLAQMQISDGFEMSFKGPPCGKRCQRLFFSFHFQNPL
jgi:hypothetical protein